MRDVERVVRPPLVRVEPGFAISPLGAPPDVEATGWRGSAPDGAAEGRSVRVGRYSARRRKEIGIGGAQTACRRGIHGWTQSKGATGAVVDAAEGGRACPCT